MISFISGKILRKGAGYIVVRANDIGFKVIVGAAYCAKTEPGTTVEIHTYHHVREDSAALYGFKSLAQLDMFELLLSVSGIGPKSALAVLSVAGVEDLRESIARSDSSLLVKVSGIGKKNGRTSGT